MSQLIGGPVTTVARVNVVWLDTLRGLSVIVVGGAFVHQRLSDDSPSIFWITLAVTAILLNLAWVGLRHLGRPLPLGLNGGVVAVSGPLLYVANNGWITGRPTKILGSWPRDTVTLERVNRLGLRRLLNPKRT